MFYAVSIGRRAGIFLLWQECEAVVSAYSGAVYRKCESLREATQYMNSCGYRHDDILIHTSAKSLSLDQYCLQNILLTPAEIGYSLCNLFDLGNGLQVEACYFRGEPRIDIRVWDSGKRTKKGISLTLSQWVDLLTVGAKLDADLERVKAGEDVHSSYHLDQGVFATIDSPYRVFHIRRWYQQSDEWKPGRQGITVREREWRHLLDLEKHIIRALKEQQDE